MMTGETHPSSAFVRTFLQRKIFEQVGVALSRIDGDARRQALGRREKGNPDALSVSAIRIAALMDIVESEKHDYRILQRQKPIATVTFLGPV